MAILQSSSKLKLSAHVRCKILMLSMNHGGEFGKIRSVFSGSPAMVVTQNASETGIASNFTRVRRACSVREWNGPNESVFCSLIRTDRVLKGHVFPEQVFEVPFAEDDKVLQTLVADGLGRTARQTRSDSATRVRVFSLSRPHFQSPRQIFR